MEILNALPSVQANQGSSVGASSQLGEQDFFTLLTAQLRSQNPLEPMDDQQFLSELAQFSSLEQLSDVNNNLLGLAVQQEQLASYGLLSQSAALIGHSIEYLDPETGELAQGKVRAIRMEEGTVTVDLGDNSIPINLVSGVIEEPEAEEDAGDDEDAEGEE